MNEIASIRPATEHDRDAIGAIAAATDLFPAEMLDEMFAPYLKGESPDIWFVHELEGQVISFGFCEPERMTEGTWNLLAIGVVPDRQGSGVGGKMMAYLEQILRDQGERILIVETMGTPELALTRKFYRKHDYSEEARIREFYEAGADKVVFWKKVENSIT